MLSEESLSEREKLIQCERQIINLCIARQSMSGVKSCLNIVTKLKTYYNLSNPPISSSMEQIISRARKRDKRLEFAVSKVKEREK